MLNAEWCKREVDGDPETGNKREILQYFSVRAEQRALCTTRAYASHPRPSSCESAPSLRARLEQRPLCNFFSLPPQVLLQCCGLMVFSPEPCASSGGRLPEALFMGFLSDSKSAKACNSCRSRQELPNEYLLAKICFDTAENGLLKVCQQLAKS